MRISPFYFINNIKKWKVIFVNFEELITAHNSQHLLTDLPHVSNQMRVVLWMLIFQPPWFDAMSSQSRTSRAQQTCDSLASILSYYENHVPTDQAPDFTKCILSASIPIDVRKGDVPSAEQGEELKKTLDDALKTQDAIDNLSKSEKDLMIQVAQASLQVWKCD